MLPKKEGTPSHGQPKSNHVKGSSPPALGDWYELRSPPLTQSTPNSLELLVLAVLFVESRLLKLVLLHRLNRIR